TQSVLDLVVLPPVVDDRLHDDGAGLVLRLAGGDADLGGVDGYGRPQHVDDPEGVVDRYAGLPVGGCIEVLAVVAVDQPTPLVVIARVVPPPTAGYVDPLTLPLEPLSVRQTSHRSDPAVLGVLWDDVLAGPAVLDG